MTTNINTLLNKKKWRGEEVGQALIVNLVNDYKMRATPGHPPLFSEADLKRMTASLESDRDIKAYRTYANLYGGLVSQHNRNEAVRQQAQHGHYMLLMYVTNAEQARLAEQEIEGLPVIMTEKQYKETMAKREAQRRTCAESYPGLIFAALGYYLGEYAGAKPKVPKPIKDALQALKKRPFKNKHILGLINETYGIGYYLFPNGKRSDQLTEEEYQNELRAIGDHAEIQDIISEGDTDSEAATAFRLRRLKAEWYGAEEEKKEWPKWVVDPEPPGGLTCWDVLAGDYDMREAYSGVLGEYEGEEKAFFKEFIADFPDLYKALREDIAGHKAIKHLADTKPAQYFKEVITWGELADAGVYGYPEMIKEGIKDAYGQPYEEEDSPHRIRARMNGVAILTPDSTTSFNIDENGYYKEQPYRGIYGLFSSIEALAANEAIKAHIRVAREELLIPALKEVAAYYALLSLIGELYKIPELEEMKPDITFILDQVDALNGLILTLFSDLSGGNKERQALVKDLFPLIDLDAINPTEEAIEAAREKLTDRAAPVNLSDLHDLVKGLMREDERGAE